MTAPLQHLYVHVPFCAHRCGYCDFVTTAAQPELHDRYVAALASELTIRGLDGQTFATIFIGGGTPTLLQPSALLTLLDTLHQRLADGGELTIECNPETVTPQLAALLVEGGVNRVSLGAQSFNAEMLEVLERRATPETVRSAVSMLRAAGVSNLSLDVIWGVPGQTIDMLRSDLRSLIEIGPDHCSAYELEFKPGTRLTHAFESRETAVGDASDDFYECVIDTMTEAGFAWYETANFARPGRECRHNLGYWTQADYAGIGVGAVGTIAGERRTNLPNLPRYLAAVEAGELPPARTETIDEDTRQRERIMLALRLARPVTLTDLDLAQVVDHEWLDRFARGGMLHVLDHGCGADAVAGGGTTIELTRRGRLVLNGVLARLLRD